MIQFENWTRALQQFELQFPTLVNVLTHNLKSQNFFVQFSKLCQLQSESYLGHSRKQLLNKLRTQLNLTASQRFVLGFVLCQAEWLQDTLWTQAHPERLKESPLQSYTKWLSKES